MKAVSIGHYVGTMGSVVQEQQSFIKKLMDALQLLQPQPKEFTNQLNQLRSQFEEMVANHHLENHQEMEEFDSIAPQTQKDLEAIRVQLRTFKAANVKKGQGQTDLTAVEKTKKLKDQFKEYKTQSSNDIAELKNSIEEIKNQYKNNLETITNIQAKIQASQDEVETIRTCIPTEDEKDEMNNHVNDMATEIEAIRAALDVMHQESVTTEDLAKFKQHQKQSLDHLKNSMQQIKVEMGNIQEGAVPTNVKDILDSLENSVSQLKGDVDDVKSNVDAKYALLQKAQEDLETLKDEMSKWKEQAQPERASPPSSPRLKQIQDDQYAELSERLEKIERQLEGNQPQQVPTTPRSIAASRRQSPRGNKNAEEFKYLDTKIEETIDAIQNSAIQERSPRTDIAKPINELKSLQRALLSIQEHAEEEEPTIYDSVEPTHLPLVVKSMDEVLKDFYSEFYQTRDQMKNKLQELQAAIDKINQNPWIAGNEEENVIERGIDLDDADSLQSELDELTRQLNDPSLYENGEESSEKVREMQERKKQLEEQLSKPKQKAEILTPQTLNEKIQQLSDHIETLESNIEQRNGELDERHASTTESIQKQANDLQEFHQTVEQRNTELDQRHTSITESIEKQSNDLQEFHQAVEQRNTELDERHAAVANSIEKQANDLQEFHQAVDQRNTELDERHTAVTESIQKQANDLQEFHQTVEQRNTELDQRHTAVTESIEKQSNDLQEFHQAVDQRNTELDERHTAVTESIEKQANDLQEFHQAVEQRNIELDERHTAVTDTINKQTNGLKEFQKYIEENIEVRIQALEDALLTKDKPLSVENTRKENPYSQIIKEKIDILTQELDNMDSESPQDSEKVKQAHRQLDLLKEAFETINQQGENEPDEITFESLHQMVQELQGQIALMNADQKGQKDAAESFRSSIRGLKYEVKKLKNKSEEVITPTSNMQWPEIKSPKKKKQTNPFVETIKTKAQDLVDEMNNAETQEDDDIEQIKQPLGESQSKLNNMLSIIQQMHENDELAQYEQLTPETMWNAILNLQQRVSQLDGGEIEEFTERDITLPSESSGSGQLAKLQYSVRCIKHELKKLLEREIQPVVQNSDEIEEMKEEIQQIKEQIEETSFLKAKSVSTTHTKVPQIQNGISELIQQINNPELEDEEDATGELKPSLKDAQKQLENVQKTLDDILAEERELQNLESPAQLVKMLQQLSSRLRMVESENKQQAERIKELEGKTVNVQTREIQLDDIESEQNEIHDIKDSIQLIENKIGRLTTEQQTMSNLMTKRYTELQQVKENISQEVLKKVDRIQNDLNNHITDHPLMKGAPITVPSDSFVKSKPSAAVETLKNQVQDILSQIDEANQTTTEETVIPPELNQLNGDLMKLQQTLQKVSSQQIYIPAQEALESITDSLQELQEKVNTQSERINEIQAHDQNNLTEQFDQISQEIKSLKEQFDDSLKSTDEKITNDVQDSLLPVTQKVSSIDRALNGLKNQITQSQELTKLEKEVLERSTAPDFWYEESSPNKLNHKEAIVTLQKQVEEFLAKLDEETQVTEEEEIASEEIQTNLDQTKERLLSLQRVLQHLIDRDNEPDPMTPERFMQILNTVQERLSNVEETAADIESLRYSLRCLKYAVKKIRDEGLGTNPELLNQMSTRSFFASPKKRKSTKAFAEMKEDIDQLLTHMNNPDFDEDSNDEQIKPSMKKAQEDLLHLQTTLDNLLSEEQTVDVTTLTPEGIYELLNDTQEKVQVLEAAVQKQNEIMKDFFGDEANEEVIRERAVQIENNDLETIQNDIEQLKQSIAEQQELLQVFDPKQKKQSNELVQSLTEQIDKLMNDLNQPSLQTEENSREDLKERKAQAQAKLEHLQESLRKILESAPLSPTDIVESIKILRAKVAALEELAENPKIKDRGAEIDVLNEKVEEIQELKEKLNGIEVNIQENQNMLNSQKSDVQGLQGLVNDGIMNRIANVEQKIDDHIAAQEQVEQFVPLTSSSAVAKVNQQIDELLTKLSDPELNVHEREVTIDEFDEEEDELQSGIKAVHHDLRLFQTSLARLQGLAVYEPADDVMNQIYSMIKSQDEANKRQDEEINSLRQYIKTPFDVERVVQLEHEVAELKKKNSELVSDLSKRSFVIENEEQKPVVTQTAEPERNAPTRVADSLVEFSQDVDTLVQQLRDTDISVNEEEADVSTRISDAKNKLDSLRTTLKEVAQQQSQNDSLSPENLFKAINELQAQFSNIQQEMQPTIRCLKHEIRTLKNRQSELQEEVDDRCKSVEILHEETEKRLREDTNKFKRQIRSSGVAKKKRPTAAIESVKQNIEELNEKMNDPSFKQEAEIAPDSSEFDSRKEQAQHNLTLLSETLSKLLEQKDPEYPDIETLQLMIQELQAKVTYLELQIQENSSKRRTRHHTEITTRDIELNLEEEELTEDEIIERKVDNMTNDFNSMKRTVEELQAKVNNQQSTWTIQSPKKEKKPVNPAMKTLEERITTFMQQMDDPSLHNEEDESNSRIKPNIMRTEAELKQLQDTLKNLIEHPYEEDVYEPLVITPEYLLEMIHNIEDDISSLKDAQNGYLSGDAQTYYDHANMLQEQQHTITDQFNALKNKFELMKEKLAQYEENENDNNNAIEDLKEMVESIQNRIDEIDEQQDSEWIISSRSQNRPIIEYYKKQVDDLYQQIQDTNNDELTPGIEKAKAGLKALQERFVELTEENEPITLSPEKLYELIQSLQIDLLSMKHKQASQMDEIQKEIVIPILNKQSQLEHTVNKQLSNGDEDWKHKVEQIENQLKKLATDINTLQQSLNEMVQDNTKSQLNETSQLEGDVSTMKTSLADLKSEMEKLHKAQKFAIQKSSPVKLDASQQIQLPTTPEESLSFVDRFEQIALGFEKHLKKAQEDIQKVAEMKNEYKQDSAYIQSLEKTVSDLKDEVSQSGSTITSLRTELNLIQTQLGESNEMTTSLEALKDEIKGLKDGKVITRSIDFVGFNNQTEQVSIKGLSSKVDQFVESTNKDIGALQPDIENAQNELRSLQSALHEMLDKPAADVITPLSLHQMFTELQSQVDSIQRIVDKNDETLQALADHQKTLENHQEQITNNKTGIDGHSTQLGEHSSQLEKHSSGILENKNTNEKQQLLIDEQKLLIEEQKQLLDELRQQLDEQSKQNEKHQETIDQLTQQLETHSKQNEEQQKNIDQITQKLENQDKINEEKQASIDQLTKSVEDHTKQNEEQQNSINQLTQQNEEQQKNIDQLTQTVGDHTEQNKEQQNSIDQLNQQNQEQQNSLNQLNQQNEEQQNSLNKLDQQNQEQQNSLNQLNQQNEEQQNNLNQHAQQLQDHQNSIDQITQTLENQDNINKEHQAALNQLTQTVEDHTKQNEEQQNSINKLDQQNQEQQNSLNQLNQQNQEQQKSLNQLTQTVEDHTKQNEEQQNSINQLTQQNEEQQKNIDQLTQTVENHTKENAEQQKSIDQLTQQNEEQQNSLNQLNQQNQEQQNSLNQLNQQNQEQQNSLNQLNQQNQEQQNSLNQHAQQLQDHQNSIDQITQTLENQDNINKEQQAALNQLTQTVEDHTKQNEEQQKALNELTQKLDETNNEIKERNGQIDREIEGIKENAQQLSQNLTQLNESISQAQQTTMKSLRCVKHELKKVKEGEVKVQSAIQNVESQVLSFSSQVDEVKQAQTTLNGRIEELNTDMSAKISEINQAHEDQIKEIQNDVDSKYKELTSALTDLQTHVQEDNKNLTDQLTEINEKIATEVKQLHDEIEQLSKVMNTIDEVKRELEQCKLDNNASRVETVQQEVKKLEGHMKDVMKTSELHSRALKKSEKQIAPIKENLDEMQNFINSSQFISKDDFRNFEEKYEEQIKQMKTAISAFTSSQEAQVRAIVQDLVGNPESSQMQSFSSDQQTPNLDEIWSHVKKMSKAIKSNQAKIDKLSQSVSQNH